MLEKAKASLEFLGWVKRFLEWFTIEDLKKLINWDYLEELTKKTETPIDNIVVAVLRKLLNV